MEAYCLYDSYTQSWTHSSKGFWNMDHTSQDRFMKKSLISSDYQTTKPTESRGLISIERKLMVCSIRTPNIGTITPRATWSILPTTPLPTWTKTLLVQAIIRLTNALRPEGWFPFCGSLLYLYTQSLTDSSKLYLEHGPYFLRYTNLHIWKCSMFKPLSDYLTHCVQKAVFHLMEAYGQYYSYSQSWTHSSNGCLVHGPYFLRYACRHIRKCTMFKPLWDYPTRCV